MPSINRFFKGRRDGRGYAFALRATGVIRRAFIRDGLPLPPAQRIARLFNLPENLVQRTWAKRGYPRVRRVDLCRTPSSEGRATPHAIQWPMGLSSSSFQEWVLLVASGMLLEPDDNDTEALKDH